MLLFQINAEFQRLMTVSLEPKFMAQLDVYTSQLMRVVCAKGGATHQKTADIMAAFDQVALLYERRSLISARGGTLYLYKY